VCSRSAFIDQPSPLILVVETSCSTWTAIATSHSVLPPTQGELASATSSVNMLRMNHCSSLNGLARQWKIIICDKKTGALVEHDSPSIQPILLCELYEHHI